MSIKNKRDFIPSDGFDDLPPYSESEICWGCGKLFDFTELMNGSELCYKCNKIINSNENI